MNDLWARVGRVWSSYRQPLRPGNGVAEQIRQLLAPGEAEVLLLGVTPEFARLGRTLTAVDVAPAMVAVVWPGDTDDHRAVTANWLDMPVPAGSIDAVVGDGVLTVVGGHQSRLALLAQIARTLRPGGRAALRLFACPEGGDSIDAIVADGLAGRISTTSELAMRLFFAMPKSGPDYLLDYREVFRVFQDTFPDRDPLMQACGFVPDDFAFLDLYATSDTANSWGPAAVAVAEASHYFGEVRLVPTSGYPRSEWCPILYLARPVST